MTSKDDKLPQDFGCDVLGLPEKHNPKLVALFTPHIESFNFAVKEGLVRAVPDVDPLEFKLEDGPEIKVWFEEVQVSTPAKDNVTFEKLWPGECREGGLSYTAPCIASIRYKIGPKGGLFQRGMGRIPIMVKSDKCHLHGLSPTQLVKRHEEAAEQGGYFIVNGLEKLMRMLIMPRRNYVMAQARGAYTKKGPNYTQYGTSIRCVRPDQSAVSVTLHYLSTGSCNIRITIKKQEFFLPAVLLLKALIPTTDREIYSNLVRNDTSNTFLTDRVEVVLREAQKWDNLHTKEECLAFLGATFRVALQRHQKYSDIEVGEYLLEKYLFVHLEPDNNRAKFDLLIYMMRKLYSLANGLIGEDNSDSIMNQEILLPGHLYLMFFKEKLQEWLDTLRVIMTTLHRKPKRPSYEDAEGYIKKCCEKNFDLGQKFNYFLATGNLRSSTGLGLMQTSGFAVLADKLNYLRYFSHFRCVHRGAFFANMKTTSVRKLMPDSWGFFCPVHTPDGAPCGLLNHLTSACKIITTRSRTGALPRVLASLGMVPASQSIVYPKQYLDIFLDGQIIGFVAPHLLDSLVDKLRYLKVKKLEQVPPTLEIAFIPPESGRQYPGVFLFTTPARMMRPVKYLPTGDTEYIGTFEQVYMNIACTDEDLLQEQAKSKFSHVELGTMNMLSVVASLTPFSDMNQSPRNMYQCQMGKQTMATPMQAWVHRTDNKLYRIRTPQKPVVRTQVHVDYDIDDYPNGANAVVAVISYTGYDMEDAMIINKSAYERGFGHASVYKNEWIDIGPNGKDRKGDGKNSFFGNPATVEERAKLVGGPVDQLIEQHQKAAAMEGLENSDEGKEKEKEKDEMQGIEGEPQEFERVVHYTVPELDEDGLPRVGERLEYGSPYYCVVDYNTGQTMVKKFQSKEPAIVDEVRVMSSGSKGIQKIGVKLRFIRNPVIGDKFSSRHGQKGVMSQLWPQINMPFSESGMSPDVIINPHAFPSRMTIGMLVESMAGKSGALHGMFQDSTPFRFHEKHKAVDYFGEQLLAAGYNYYGNEPMYSGIHGTELRADIFLGVVFYQRLRHMVSDKYQVRSTGPIDKLTQQPVKGRKVGGGIRFGEMERDSLLAHGTSFLLHDRLMKCSDDHRGYVCTLCGGLLPTITKTTVSNKEVTCLYCNSKKGIKWVAIPFVFRYLSQELAAMGIRITLTVQ